MGADRNSTELQSATSRIERSLERVEELKQLAKRDPHRVIGFAERLLADELTAVRVEIQAAYTKGFHLEAQRCDSYLYKRQADVALAVLSSLPLNKADGQFWSGRAEKWLNESLRLYPTMQARFLLAALYASLERYDEALREAQVVVQSDDQRVRDAAQRFIHEVSSSTARSVSAQRLLHEVQISSASDLTPRYRKGADVMASFNCRECGANIPVDEHGALAGMQVSGPCPKCGSPMPLVCPNCNNRMTVSLICDHGKWKCAKCYKGGGCYIATACYGDYHHPDVLVFRRFRDASLLSSPFGRLLVSAYYTISPPLARRLGHVEWLAAFIRKWILEPLAQRLR